MRLLLLTQYYPPEVGASQERLSYLAKYLARRGHEVTVLTCKPNYPSGQLYPGYENPLWKVNEERDEHGIKILRTWVYLTRGRISFSSRMANFLSFAFSALRAWPRVGPVDLVLVETPPIFLSFTAQLYAWLKGASKVVHYADPWVSYAVEVGYLKRESLITKLAFWLEQQALSRSDLVVVPNPGIRASCLKVHELSPEKVKLVMNGADVDFYRPDAAARERKRRELDLSDKFVVVFAGSHQHQAGLDVLVRAAARLQEIAPDVRFLLVGHGADKPRIEELARQAGVLNRNFFLLNPMPATEARDLLNACDLGANPLVAMADDTLSVKLLSYLACGLPVLVTDRRIQREIVEAAGCGLTCPPEDDREWAEKILWLRDHPEQRQEMAERGRRCAVEQFSRGRHTEDFEKLLTGLVLTRHRRGGASVLKSGETLNG